MLASIRRRASAMALAVVIVPTWGRRDSKEGAATGEDQHALGMVKIGPPRRPPPVALSARRHSGQPIQACFARHGNPDFLASASLRCAIAGFDDGAVTGWPIPPNWILGGSEQAQRRQIATHPRQAAESLWICRCRAWALHGTCMICACLIGEAEKTRLASMLAVAGGLAIATSACAQTCQAADCSAAADQMTNANSGSGCAAGSCAAAGCSAAKCAPAGCAAAGCAPAGCAPAGCAAAGCTAAKCAPAGCAAKR